MAKRKRQAKKPKKSAPKKSPVKRPLPSKAGFYTAYVDRKGRRTKAGKGAKPIYVKLPKKPSRVFRGKGGKFATPNAAKKFKSARKAVATRKARNAGAFFLGKRITREARYEYHDYMIELLSPEIMESLVAREEMDGFEYYYGVISYVDYTDDPKGIHSEIGTSFYRNSTGIAAFLDRMSELMSQYGVSSVEEMTVHFTKGKDIQ